jgi:hypothetical protein
LGLIIQELQPISEKETKRSWTPHFVKLFKGKWEEEEFEEDVSLRERRERKRPAEFGWRMESWKRREWWKRGFSKPKRYRQLKRD